MSTPKKESVFHRLYVGTGAFDIVGKRKRWYVIFGTLMLVCVASIVFRWFNLGIDFEGGTQVQLPATGSAGTISTEQVTEVFTETLSREPATVVTVGTGDETSIQIRSETLSNADVAKLKDALFDKLQPREGSGAPDRAVISDSAVSASWGGEISQQALIALGVFLVLVTIFLAFYFEKWMAVAALISLVHDVVVTAGIYSLIGFEVTPATVIGLLTILGFSLYDTVVVFDKVKENTRGILGLTRRTYGEAANLAVNQTLARSINTVLIALLPVVGLLVVGVGLLGVGTLKDLALVQMTGMLVGMLSSIYLAAPLLVDFKMTEPKFQDQYRRVMARRANQARKSGSTAVEGADDDLDVNDDAALDAELRKEKAYATASSVPARTPKASDRARREQSSGRPSGKPSGKKRR